MNNSAEKNLTPKILVFACSPDDVSNPNRFSWLNEENELFTIECISGGQFWVGADNGELTDIGATLVDNALAALKGSSQKYEEIQPNINKIKSGTYDEKDELVILKEIASIICQLEIGSTQYRTVILNRDGSINEEITSSVLSNSLSQPIQGGFMDSGTDNFSELSESQLNYFSKYSDEQLDKIYETDPTNRDVIDQIRTFRADVRDH